jgi:Ca2+-binding RTX toxin-like protein
MQLENGVFDGLGAAGVLGGRYTEGTSATQVNDRIVYDQATGRVYFDEDGLGGTRKVLFAIVDAGTHLTQADFLVV